MNRRLPGLVGLRAVLAAFAATSVSLVSMATLAGPARADLGCAVWHNCSTTVNVTLISQAGGSGRVVGTRADTGAQIIDCPGDCSEPITIGSFDDWPRIELTAYPAPGSTFFWSGNCSDYESQPNCSFPATGGSADANFVGSGTPPPTDTTPPQTTFTHTPPKIVKRAQLPTLIRFSFQANEAGSSFRCRIDAKAFSPCSSPKDLRLGAGAHTFKVRAVDKAGNIDPTPASFSFTVRKP